MRPRTIVSEKLWLDGQMERKGDFVRELRQSVKGPDAQLKPRRKLAIWTNYKAEGDQGTRSYQGRMQTDTCGHIRE